MSFLPKSRTRTHDIIFSSSTSKHPKLIMLQLAKFGTIRRGALSIGKLSKHCRGQKSLQDYLRYSYPLKQTSNKALHLDSNGFAPLHFRFTV
jgi:hypothetical protein